jgi:tRNA pseudouridine32 synthase/23S rRNA pseudouridine746 synthase
VSLAAARPIANCELYAVPRPVDGCRTTYVRFNDSFLPSTLVRAPPAPLAHSWDCEVVYDSATAPRPPLIHVDPAVAAGGDAAPESKSAIIARIIAARQLDAGYTWHAAARRASAAEYLATHDLEALARRALRVLYCDGDVVVVDKPAGLLSVPGLFGRFSAADAVTRAFGLARADQAVTHRLDEATSGLLVFAKHADSQRVMHERFRDHAVRKRYTAVVAGALPAAEGEVDLPLSKDPHGRNPFQCVNVWHGKPSLTEWRVLARGGGGGGGGAGPAWTRVELTPVTGRSHQLRVHMAALGHPILGDDMYGPMGAMHVAPRLRRDLDPAAGPPAAQSKGAASGPELPRLLLHATSISFAHPATDAPVFVEAAPPF